MLSNAPITSVLPATDIEQAKKFYTEFWPLANGSSQER